MKTLLLYFCLTAGPLFGGDNFFEMNNHGPDPDHLLVVEPGRDGQLKRATKAPQIPPRTSLAESIVIGPFGGCTAAYLTGRLPYFFVKGRTHPEGEKFHLVLATCPPTKDQGYGPVENVRVEVPIDFAIAMQRLWTQFVLDSRMRGHAEYSLDGHTGYFVVRTGEEYSRAYLRDAPKGGVVEEFQALAESLQDLKKADDSAKKDLLEKLPQRMKALSQKVPPLEDVRTE